MNFFEKSSTSTLFSASSTNMRENISPWDSTPLENNTNLHQKRLNYRDFQSDQVHDSQRANQSPYFQEPPVPTTDFLEMSFETQLSNINQAFANNWTDLERTIVTLNILRRLDPKHGQFISMVANSSIFPRYQFQLSGNGGLFPKPYAKDRERASSFEALCKIAYQYDLLIQLNEIANLLPFLPENARKGKDGEIILEKYLQIINQGVIWVMDPSDPLTGEKYEKSGRNGKKGEYLNGLKIATSVLSLAIQHPAFSRDDKSFLAGLYQKIKSAADSVDLGDNQLNHESRGQCSPQNALHNQQKEQQNLQNYQNPQKMAQTMPNHQNPTPKLDAQLVNPFATNAPQRPPSQPPQRPNTLPPHNSLPQQIVSKNFNYPAQIQHWLKVHRLHKYYDVVVMYPYSELLKINAGTLEQQPITKGAQKKLIGIIEKLHEREQTLLDLNGGIVSLGKTFGESLGSQVQGKMINTFAGELKELIDTPLGPDRLDRGVVIFCMTTIIDIAQKYFLKETQLMSKLHEMVQVCEDFPGKRVPVNPQWKNIRIPQRSRYYPQQQYNSLPNHSFRDNGLATNASNSVGPPPGINAPQGLIGVGHRKSISLNRNVDFNHHFGNSNLGNSQVNEMNDSFRDLSSGSRFSESRVNNPMRSQMNKYQPQHISTDSAFEGAVSTQFYQSNDSIENKVVHRRTSVFDLTN